MTSGSQNRLVAGTTMAAASARARHWRRVNRRWALREGKLKTGCKAQERITIAMRLDEGAGASLAVKWPHAHYSPGPRSDSDALIVYA